jgi:hypothetical protein
MTKTKNLLVRCTAETFQQLDRIVESLKPTRPAINRSDVVRELIAEKDKREKRKSS